MIEFKNVSKKFDNYNALDNLNIKIPTGSIYALMGLNGAGKTTVLRHIVGYYTQDSGEILIDNENVLDNIKIKEQIEFIPDDLFFFKGYNLNDMAKYYKKMKKTWDEKRFIDMVNDFGLNPKKNLSTFSKGMKKQASFILALSSYPNYLLLDEPIDGLDPIIRHKVWQYIISDVSDRNMTCLIASHNAKEMENNCDYIGILDKGKAIFEQSLLELEDTTIEQIFIDTLNGNEVIKNEK